MTETDDFGLIPVSMLQEYSYCPRSAYMQWVQKESHDTVDMAAGRLVHKNVDKQTGTKKLQQIDDYEHIHARSVSLSDDKLGLIAKIDVLELTGRDATPVEYKHGSTPDLPGNAYPDHVTQICAQCLLLRANGFRCEEGVIYYTSSKQRVTVTFDDKTVANTLQLLHDMKEMARSATIPPPLVNSPKCPRCSLVGICLPDEINMFSDDSKVSKEHIRRMYPIRNDSHPIYVQEQGAYVSLSGDCINISSRHNPDTKLRFIDISEVTVFGNVQITTQAIKEMCKRNIPVCYLSYGGWFVGMTMGTSHKNIELRISQHNIFSQKSKSMSIAREFVYGKIKNSQTMLRRNSSDVDKKVLENLSALADRVKHTREYYTLLGLEGQAARIYFENFAGMIKSNNMDFKFEERNRRPPKDPVNAVLSFLYSMLVRQAVTIITVVGFDPYLGYLHKPKYGKPALALDIIEEFRPIVADSVCVFLINNNMLGRSDFVSSELGVNLNSDGRRKVIKAYEQRMDSTVKHDVLGYAASYRRILETQTRLLARHVMGEISSYPSFRTR